MKVLMRLGVVLMCLACVNTRLPWVLDNVTASVEKQFGPSAVYGLFFSSSMVKTDRLIVKRRRIGTVLPTKPQHPKRTTP